MNIPSDILEIFSKYYHDNPKLLATVLTHSEAVARKALQCAESKKLDIDKEFVERAALLHDIGVVKCNAPSIFCFGKLPYICHGVEGRKILEKEGLYREALVCERHTGSGLSAEYIKKENLPLPLRDMLPISLEEKLICYADKFFSKSKNLTEEKPLDSIIRQMASFGEESLSRFMDLHNLFSN